MSLLIPQEVRDRLPAQLITSQSDYDTRTYHVALFERCGVFWVETFPYEHDTVPAMHSGKMFLCNQGYDEECGTSHGDGTVEDAVNIWNWLIRGDIGREGGPGRRNGYLFHGQWIQYVPELEALERLQDPYKTKLELLGVIP